MSCMTYGIDKVKEHYVVTINGEFYCSADSLTEASKEIEDALAEKGKTMEFDKTINVLSTHTSSDPSNYKFDCNGYIKDLDPYLINGEMGYNSGWLDGI